MSKSSRKELKGCAFRLVEGFVNTLERNSLLLFGLGDGRWTVFCSRLGDLRHRYSTSLSRKYDGFNGCSGSLAEKLSSFVPLRVRIILDGTFLWNQFPSDVFNVVFSRFSSAQT